MPLPNDQNPAPGAPSTAGTAPATPRPAPPRTPDGPVLSDELNAEIEAAMADLDDAMAAPAPRVRAPASRAGRAGEGAEARAPAIRGPRVVQAGREHRSGKVVAVGPTDLFLEFGPKELGVCPRAQWPEDQIPKVGDELEVVVDRFDSTEGIFLCSRPGAVQKAAWELLEVGTTVEARVTGVNKGGLELEVAQHRAFMPAGQVALERVPDLSVFVGEKMTCVVTQVDRRGSGNIVLSRREILLQQRKEQAEKLKASLQEGQTLDGVVRKIMPFGCFVDLGGVDGLVHLSDLTYDRVGYGEKAVEKHVKEGQTVRVQILKLDWENNRVSLGIKQVQGDPFATAVNAIVEGAEVTGKVTRLAEFGAFVELAPGVDGLVHISELDHRRVARVDDVVKVDQIVQAKVLKIDKETRRISLSLKALKPLPEVTIGGGSGGKGRGPRDAGRSPEEIMKETPALRRLREKFGKQKFKGGIG